VVSYKVVAEFFHPTLAAHFSGAVGSVHPRAVWIPANTRETAKLKAKIRMIPASKSEPTDTTKASFRKSANEAEGRIEIRKVKEKR
jgi:hypothetical protein